MSDDQKIRNCIYRGFSFFLDPNFQWYRWKVKMQGNMFGEIIHDESWCVNFRKLCQLFLADLKQSGCVKFQIFCCTAPLSFMWKYFQTFGKNMLPKGWRNSENYRREFCEIGKLRAVRIGVTVYVRILNSKQSGTDRLVKWPLSLLSPTYEPRWQHACQKNHWKGGLAAARSHDSTLDELACESIVLNFFLPPYKTSSLSLDSRIFFSE